MAQFHPRWRAFAAARIYLTVFSPIFDRLQSMHCHWRQNRPFIMQCADVLGNKQVKSDPSVSDLNVSRFECQKRPWKEIEAVMGRRGVDAPHAYIRNYVLEMTPYFDWQP